MASAIKKVNTIIQIVRLKQIFQRWKNKSLTRRHISDSDEHIGPRTPSGSFAVYIGLERCRFVIPTRFLNLPVFVALLDQAEEEFGFQKTGGLILPCEPGFFKEVLRFLEDDEEKYRLLGLDEFLNLVSEMDFGQSMCKESSASENCRSFTPLLAKSGFTL